MNFRVCQDSQRMSRHDVIKMIGQWTSRGKFRFVNRIGLPAVIQILLRGPYPKPLRRFAASGLFVHSLLKASFQHSFTKTPPRLRRKGYVNRIGFEPMTCCLEGSCSIQLSYRSGNDFSWNSRKNNAFPSSGESIASGACIHLPGIQNHRKHAG